jgi:4-hydroxy-tetrahydrodipicolinate synthase
MISNTAPKGIITVLNTPFTDDDAIDVEGLARNVENAIAAGVAGVLVPAMASEVDKLSDAERELMVGTVLDIAGGRVPVIGGASALTQAERIRWTKALVGLGCNGVLVSVPFEDEAIYEREVREIAACEPPLLMIQDWDARGYGVPVPLVARLSEEIACFKSLKIEVVPAGVKYSEVLRATGGGLHVAGGWAVMQMIEALDRGVDAFMPTGMHRIYARIYDLYVSGKREEARELFENVLPVLAFSNQHLDISIHFFKRLLHAQGVYATARVREPILPFDAVHERVAAELIARVMALEAEL